MKSLVQLLARGAVALVFGLPLSAGCAATDEATENYAQEEDDAVQTAEPPVSLEETEEIGTLEEGLTSVDMLDCSICAIARSCCNAVNPSTSCNNFNAERCATLDPGRQRTTKINCLVQLRTTITAWRLSGRTPPSECFIPGE